MNIKINPDKKYVEEIREKIKDNGGFCVCSTVQDENTKCMCREFIESGSGWCHCNLYYKENS